MEGRRKVFSRTDDLIIGAINSSGGLKKFKPKPETRKIILGKVKKGTVTVTKEGSKSVLENYVKENFRNYIRTRMDGSSSGDNKSKSSKGN